MSTFTDSDILSALSCDFEKVLPEGIEPFSAEWHEAWRDFVWDRQCGGHERGERANHERAQ